MIEISMPCRKWPPRWIVPVEGGWLVESSLTESHLAYSNDLQVNMVSFDSFRPLGRGRIVCDRTGIYSFKPLKKKPDWYHARGNPQIYLDIAFGQDGRFGASPMAQRIEFLILSDNKVDLCVIDRVRKRYDFLQVGGVDLASISWDGTTIAIVSKRKRLIRIIDNPLWDT